jgi:amidase
MAKVRSEPAISVDLMPRIKTLSGEVKAGATRHPAMAVPCGMSDGLPVSLMLVAKHFDEPTIYKAAFAFEQAGDWKKM